MYNIYNMNFAMNAESVKILGCFKVVSGEVSVIMPRMASETPESLAPATGVVPIHRLPEFTVSTFIVVAFYFLIYLNIL